MKDNTRSLKLTKTDLRVIDFVEKAAAHILGFPGNRAKLLYVDASIVDIPGEGDEHRTVFYTAGISSTFTEKPNVISGEAHFTRHTAGLNWPEDEGWVPVDASASSNGNRSTPTPSAHYRAHGQEV